MRIVFLLASLLMVVACSSTPTPAPVAVQAPAPAPASLVCDSYIVMDMCVQDLRGDGTVDMVFFSDSNEVFMYQQGQKQTVAEVMAFHRCAVPLNEGMQNITNRILHRKNMSLTEEVDIARKLITNYLAAKPEIDACNAQFEDAAPATLAEDDESFMDDLDWGDV
ncbi:MAG: hypothetical protein ABJ308_19015 [Halieaceae bacterium]